MLGKYNKNKNGFYYLISLIEPKILPEVLKFFEYSDILDFIDKIDLVDFSNFNSEVLEKVLIEYNEFMMIALNIDKNEDFKLNNVYLSENSELEQIFKSLKNEYLKHESFIQAEKKSLIQKLISKINSKFNLNEFMEREYYNPQISEFNEEETWEFSPDTKMRIELLKNFDSLSSERPFEAFIVFKYML